MADKNKKQTLAKKSSDDIDEMEELKIFLKRKKIETEALKKIINKLNTDENLTKENK